MGRNQEYSFSVSGPVIHRIDGSRARGVWHVSSQTRFDEKLSITVHIAVSPWFQAIVDAPAITSRHAWFKHPDRKRSTDPIRRISTQSNGIDCVYFEEVEYPRSGWFNYNRARFETEITVTGLLVATLPANTDVEPAPL